MGEGWEKRGSIGEVEPGSLLKRYHAGEHQTYG